MSKTNITAGASLVASLGAAITFVALLGLPLALGRPASFSASLPVLSDFMIQNVCLDASGAVLEGVSPIDGGGRCIAQRDLMPGESLPYHKHDQPATADRASMPRGYQRHDSFPVETTAFGVVVEHSFDFGTGEGRRFGVFDAGQGDGGDITLLTPDAISFAATEDGGAGFQLFVGANCKRQVDAAALADSWLIARPNPGTPSPGQSVARLKDLREGRQGACPARLDAAFTRWYVQPMRYRAGDGQGAPVTLTTLISEHYGGEHPDSADHVERFYFTRELGSTRWERWQSLMHGHDTGQLAKKASDFTDAGRCSKAAVPAGGARFVMVDCREWTLIVPPDNPAGDRPGFLIDAVNSRRLAAGLLSAPANPR
jgi:hypothetical protein